MLLTYELATKNLNQKRNTRFPDLLSDFVSLAKG
jgi:hypothetical protein